MQIKKAIIPAAGLGKRFMPVTEYVPKEMFPVGCKPNLQYLIEECKLSGITDIAIITSPGKKKLLSEYFLNEATIIVQDTANGLGDAILRAESFVGNEPFAVLLGDNFAHPIHRMIGQLMCVYDIEPASVIGADRIQAIDTYRYGIINEFEKVFGTIFKVKELIEKPAPTQAKSNLAIMGRYIFNPQIFDALKITAPDHKNEIQLTDAIIKLMEWEPVQAVHMNGNIYDIGTPLGLTKANIDFEMYEHSAEMSKFMKDMLLSWKEEKQ